MRATKTVALLIAVGLTLFGAVGYAQDSRTLQSQESQGTTLKLTPRVRELLAEEMKAIRHSMDEILDGMISGNSVQVAKAGDQIFDGFILNQKLTIEDRKVLEKALTPEFLELDQKFHQSGMKLAIASVNKDTELQRYHLSNMIAACIECHQKYAAEKFPLFHRRPAPGAPAGGHMH